MTVAPPPIVVACGAATDPGLRRALNEDSHIAAAPVFLVADGMGGHHAGEVASATVIDEFAQLVGRPSVALAEVRATLGRARQRVHALPAGDGASAGTTLSGVVVCDVDGTAYWLTLNVGDSRTYRFFEGELEQLSVDHTVVQELVAAGTLTVAAARTDSRRNVITRAIGADSESETDYWLVPAEQGDRILVCSDGLPDELEDDAIAAILGSVADPQEAATRLVHEAMLKGGRDNITAVVADAVTVHGSDGSRALDRTVPPAAPIEPPTDDDLDEDTRPRAMTGGARR
ncbi:PP2C family serine/threonine-protein phosphatase [Microbacterium sp. C7(2022)]|uniref:PP2C family protein-serine/threonine phosphatase n=1 Tax=Microbacterium sp. C7(2022) TaxID=2992759 RepID=UPI00237BF185|nr:protein phosphatase 2C domain-containing protein [Microbacterium sp. C7(2022)]MDE0545148.1 protein phosphatase 2C domain-containing protein [Microbacterium sp. C7(2022)]